MLDELYWGLEEQDVPCRAICRDEHDCALALSKLAVESLTPHASLGLDIMGGIALAHAQLPEGRALIRGRIRAEAAQLRVPSANADQLVKVLPLSEIN